MNQDNPENANVNEEDPIEPKEPKTSYDPRPLVLHVASFRRYYGRGAGLTQNELSLLTGLSERTLRRMETDRELAPVVEALLRLAALHRVHVEDLIAPSILAAIRADIEGRRSRAGLNAYDDLDQGCSRCHVHEF